MAASFDTLAQFYTHGFDAVIDVRSPDEYADDHIPGAINLPVLSNAQRAEVGTMYVQDSPFRARKLGAAIVARNAADHIAGPLADYDGSWKPLVYCWRGGQRSGSFTGILQQIGWRADVVAGGYQAYRRLVHHALYNDPLPHRFILLDGNTGTAKTAILAHLSQMDVQVIDLEGLANHRGSLLGGLPGGQPQQKGFESALAHALSALNPARPVVVEAESSKIGDLSLPSQVWATMKAAPRIDISAPIEARAAFLTQVYQGAIQRAETEPDNIAALLDRLRTTRGHATVDAWQDHLQHARFEALATALMQDHYDPSYARSRSKIAHEVIGQLHSETLDVAGQMSLAQGVADIVKAQA